MQVEAVIRICSTCNKPLNWSDCESGQTGVLCCDRYYHEGECLDKSFQLHDGTYAYTWDDHYEEDGDCYYTDWELEILEKVG